MYIISNDYKIKLNQLFNIDCDDLCLLKVKYYDFNNKVQNGEIICNKIIYNDLEEIFKELYNNKYQIEKIKLIDEYNYNDILSMEDDNTSCFNYRKILGTDKLSMHSYGLAIDINPLYNPYILEDNSILPSNGREYADRKKAFKHKIDENDLCYKLFIEHGFIWGGNWEYPDYQHFERRKNVNQDKYIYSELLSKHLDIINLFTKKPFNFRKNIVPIEIINENYSVIEKDCNYKFRKIIKPIQTHTNKVEIVTESNIEILKMKIESTTKQIDKYVMLRDNIKNDLQEGFINEDEYWEYSNEYSIEIKKMKSIHKELVEKLNKVDLSTEGNKDWMNKFKELKYIEKLDKTIIDELIEDIVIDDDRNIKIIFKYEDKYFEALDFINKQKCDIM